MNKNFYNICRVFTLAFITTMFTTAPGAQALSWSLTDYMSSTRWSCWASQLVTGEEQEWNYCTYVKGTSAPFHGSVSLTNYYIISAISGWSDVGGPFSITPYNPWITTMSCKAQMTVLPHYTLNTDTRLEVIDAATWTYVTTKRQYYRSTANPGRTTISTPNWAPSAKDIFVRIGIIGESGHGILAVDDTKVSCTY